MSVPARDLAFRTAFLAVCLGALAAPASAQTVVPAGNLVGSQTWSPAGSPYILTGDVTVPAGITLSILAGTDVRLGPGDTSGSGSDMALTELRVAGTLAISGTTMVPVSFASNAMPLSNYYGIVLLAGASANITSADIRNASRGIYSQATGVAINDLRVSGSVTGVEVAGGSLTLTGSAISQVTQYGVYASAGTLTASGLTITQAGSYGVYCNNAECSVTQSLIRNNTSRGLYLRTDSGTHTYSVTKNTIYGNNSYGVYVIESAGTLNATVRDNIILDNGTYGLYVSGTPNMTVSNNLVFGQTTAYNNVVAGTGAVAENALLVDSANGDFRPTSRSGARNAASDGTDIGAFAFNGAITAQLTGHLFQNTTFTAAASPYLVTGDLTVEPGVTLTVEPGAIVRFAAGTDGMGAGTATDRTELRVRGTLVADGTTTLGIRFESAAGSGVAGDWYGIALLPGASASIIDFATIRHGRYGIHTSAAAGTIVQRSIIESSSTYGIYADAGSIELADNLIRTSGSYGAYFNNADGIIRQNRFFDNTSRGLYLRSDSGTHTISATHNTITGNNSYGIYVIESAGTLNVTVRDNIIVNNVTYGLYVSGTPNMTVSNNLVWGQTTNYNNVVPGNGAISENPLVVDAVGRDMRVTTNSPARGHASDATDIGALQFDGAPTVGVHGHLYDATAWSGTVDVLGDVTVEPGVTLTIAAGTIVRFAANTDSMGGNIDVAETELIVRGRLIADGTPASRITFTSAAATPATADWYGIQLTASAGSSVIDNALIELTRYGIHTQAPATTVVSRTEIRSAQSYGVYADGGAITLTGLTVHGSGSYGLYSNNADPTITNSVIYSNTSRGVYVRTDSGTHTIVANHLTVWGNNSYGIYVIESAGTLNFTLRNSIIAENGTYGIYVSGTPNVTLANNDVWGQTTNYNNVVAGPGSSSSNPQFVSTMLENFHLLPNSPAIDAAQAASAAPEDLEGNARTVDGDMNGSTIADLGAFEFNPSGNRWPVADAGADRVVTSNVQVTFSGAASFDPDGVVMLYVWDFGDGTPSASGATVNHTFAGGTDRVVTLTVTDNAGAIDVDTVNVEVNVPPTAEAGPDRFADPGEAVSFTGSASTDGDGSIASYQWNFGDGASGSGVSVMHTYATGGNYTVTLTITDDDGATATDTTTARITGNDGAPPAIVHTPIAAGRPLNQPVLVSADITDSSGVQSATLYYRPTGGGAFTPLAMSNVGGATYQATIPGPSVTAAGVDYYLQATDSAMASNVGRSPAAAPASFYSFTVVAASAPSIAHTLVGSGQLSGQPVTIAALVTSMSPLNSVHLYYRAQGGGSFTSLAMTTMGGGNYSAQIPGAAVAPPGVEYYIEATDSQMPAITVTSPASSGSVHGFAVTPADNAPPSITHTRIANGQPESADVMISAAVTDGSGVASVTLRYRVSGGGAFATAAMSASGGSNYTGTIPAGSVTRAGVDYYISATDTASPPNSGSDPAGAPGAFHTFTVQRTFTVRVGDIIVTEVMNDPSGTETQREWFEVYNTTAAAIDINGLELADDGSDNFVITSAMPLMVSAGGYFVLGRSADMMLNGGVRVDYVYSGFALSNASDELVIRAGALEVDRVAYDGGMTFPQVPGRAFALDPTTLDYASNDDGTSWCQATTMLSGGDFGTPGAVNDPCQTAPDTTPPAIVHSPIADGQQSGVAVAVNAVVTDASGLGTVELFHRPATGGAFTRVVMTSMSGGNYQGSIPAMAVTTAGVQYYLRATDTVMNEAFAPTNGATMPLAFIVTTTDSSGPSITHAPITGPQPAGADLMVRATITDPSGVASAAVNYRTGSSGAFTRLALVASGNDYSAQIPGAAVASPSLEYYLEATDSSATSNGSSLPVTGASAPFQVVINVVDLTPPTIVHTPISGSVPQGQPVAITANVTDVSGVAEVRVYFRSAGGASFLSAPLTSAGNGDFTGEIPAALIQGTGVDYYLEATDASPDDNRARLPEADVFSFTIDMTSGEDTMPPAILHIPVPNGRAERAAVEILAEIVDPSGVLKASVSFRTRGTTELSELPLEREMGTDRWKVSLPAASIVAPGIEYFIRATDGSPRMNAASRPLAAPAEVFSFNVTPTVVPPDPVDRAGGCATSSTGSAPIEALLALLGMVLIGRRRSRSAVI